MLKTTLLGKFCTFNYCYFHMKINHNSFFEIRRTFYYLLRKSNLALIMIVFSDETYLRSDIKAPKLGRGLNILNQMHFIISMLFSSSKVLNGTFFFSFMNPNSYSFHIQLAHKISTLLYLLTLSLHVWE